MTTPIERAKALLKTIPYTKALADCVAGYPDHDESYWTPTEVAENLVKYFGYQVAIDGDWVPGKSDLGLDSSFGREDVRIVDEQSVPLGISKYRGLPHLPRDMPWPAGLYFAAQLNLAELAKVDVSGRLPKDGMLYFFYNGGLEFQVTHWQGDVDELERRPYPDPSTLPLAQFYYEQFRVGERIVFSPHWLFVPSESDLYDHSGFRGALPADLLAEVSRILGAPLADYDCDRRIYGRPFYFQDEEGRPDGFDEDGQPFWNDEEPIGFDENGEPLFQEPEPRLLLFHDCFDDAMVHFMCSPEDAARGDFSAVEVTASTT